ncbi:hypothetical protein DFH29DRAFT_414012 [Suillus ampliporus]|nr:hypothetical protein DFH29DRAFT_414012 [Suillus ampliporus]
MAHLPLPYQQSSASARIFLSRPSHEGSDRTRSGQTSTTLNTQNHLYHGLSSPHRPSISRTSSMNSSLGELPISPLFSPDSPPASPLGDNVSTLCPILEAVESASKLSCRTVCVTCLKTGRDFPHCPRCGDMWCSRECRMQGGKRHVCRT